jgi:hypothetical protein
MKGDQKRDCLKGGKNLADRDIWTLPRNRVIVIQREILGKLANRMKAAHRRKST